AGAKPRNSAGTERKPYLLQGTSAQKKLLPVAAVSLLSRFSLVALALLFFSNDLFCQLSRELLVMIEGTYEGSPTLSHGSQFDCEPEHLAHRHQSFYHLGAISRIHTE